MLNSMTGFGKGEAAHPAGKVEVEVNSLNRKHFELSVYLPKNLTELESGIRKQVSKAINRGRVNVQVNLDTQARAGKVEVDKQLARKYFQTYKRLKNEFGLGGQVDLSLIVQAPDVVKYYPYRLTAQQIGPSIQKALSAALKALQKMRAVEGKALFREISSRLRLIRSSVNRVKKTVGRTVKSYESRLIKKVREADSNARKNEDIIMKEVAIFADRIDVTEEISRLESHLKQFEQMIRKKEPVGRSLDFLLQEMHREVNTIGSKANNAVIAREVVHLKSEVEKIREQVQNVE